MARRKAGFRAAVEVVKSKENIPMGTRREVASAMGKMAESIVRQHAMNQQYATTGEYLQDLPDQTAPSAPVSPRGRLGSTFQYNREYAKRHGYQRNRVDLGASQGGGMIGALQGGARISSDSITAIVKFSTRRAARIFRYHQIEGTGENRIRRVFVYFTPREQQRIIEAGLSAGGLLQQ